MVLVKGEWFDLYVVLAVKYGKDDRLATKIVVFSTVVSLITLPVWCYILTV